MKIKCIVYGGLFSLSTVALHAMSPAVSFSQEQIIYEFPSAKTVCHNQATENERDEVEIDFDAIDRQLELLDIQPKPEQPSWWITKQVKYYGIRIGIKLLLGYVALKEYCKRTWKNLSKKKKLKKHHGTKTA